MELIFELKLKFFISGVKSVERQWIRNGIRLLRDNIGFQLVFQIIFTDVLSKIQYNTAQLQTNKKIAMLQSTQKQKKQKKPIAVNSQFTAFSFKKGPRDGLSLSNSRGKKYLNRHFNSNRMKTSQNQITSSFTKKVNGEGLCYDNDYGLNLNSNNAQEFRRISDPKLNNQLQKTDQSSSKNKIRLLKNTSVKKYRKYSDKAKSCQSMIRVAQRSPKKRSLLRTEHKQEPIESHTPESPPQISYYRQQIKYLQKQNQYYSGLFLNTQHRLESLQKQSQTEKRKYERVRKLYQQKLEQMNANKESCQRNLGHIFSYESRNVDLVPEDVIVESSVEHSGMDLGVGSRKNSEGMESKMSTLSVNSR